MQKPEKLASFLIWPVFLVIVLHYFRQVDAGGESYKTGDWLINYAGGPVRRGLIGSLLGYFSGFGPPLKWLVFLVQTTFYFMIFLYTQRIYLLRERGSQWLLLLFSPAFIFFSFYDLQGGFRKEIIVFTSFLILAHAYARKNVSVETIAVSFLLFVLAGFSHELTAFTLPFFAYILFKSFRERLISQRLATTSVLVFGVTALIILLFAMAFPGGVTVERQICASVMTRGFTHKICDGAIYWIGLDGRDALQGVVDMLPRYVFVYPFLALLAVFPLFLTDWYKQNRVFLGFALGFLAPLFVVATDWGRWINIYIFFVFIILFAESTWQDIQIRKLPTWVMLVYLTVWSVPHWNAHRMGYGLFEFVVKLASHLT